MRDLLLFLISLCLFGILIKLYVVPSAPDFDFNNERNKSIEFEGCEYVAFYNGMYWDILHKNSCKNHVK